MSHTNNDSPKKYKSLNNNNGTHQKYAINSHQQSPSPKAATTSSLSSSSSLSTNNVYNFSNIPFSANLTTVLNDPRKDRSKFTNLFTKTWGSDFVEDPSFPEFAVTIFPHVSSSEFKHYSSQTVSKIARHTQNTQVNKTLISSMIKAETQSEVEQIPKLFFDSKFSLEDKDTFTNVLNLFTTTTKNNSSDANQTTNTFTKPQADPVNTLQSQKAAGKALIEKLSSFLDMTEFQISKQISTKANSFFTAMESQNEVRMYISKTSKSVESLRKNIKSLDENVVLKSFKVLQLVATRAKYAKLLEKLELISSVHQTQRTIQLNLATDEFTGSLDLISISQDILQKNLTNIHSLRHYSSQLNEIENCIEKILNKEYLSYIDNDLSRPFVDGDCLYDKEKLTSLLFAILRLKNSVFIDLFKEEINIYLKSTIKQTVIEYVAQIDDDYNEDTNVSLIERVRQLGFQEFLHLLSRVLCNCKIMLGRIKSICDLSYVILDSAVGQHNDNGIENISSTQKEILSGTDHLRISSSIRELLISSSDYAQERLVKLLEGKTKDNSVDKLNTNDFVSLSNLLEQFIIDFDAIADKKLSTLRSWLQNQGTKFLIRFHLERKDRLTIVLDNERWKVYEVPIEIQFLVDHIAENGLSIPMRKSDGSNKKQNEYLEVKNEKYVVVATVLVLIKIMVEYCQFLIDIPTLSFDVMNRLIELFKIFNSRTCQLILGAGALQMAGLKTITVKHLALAYRCLELILYYLPNVREFFQTKIDDKYLKSSLKQFDQLIKDYDDHRNELNNKLLNIVDDVFKEHLHNYEVKAPVPSQCFRTICQQITKIHELLLDIFTQDKIIDLFSRINDMFKMRLSGRLKDLNVVNDGGPQHALIFSDMSYYIKQFKNLSGLHLIPLGLEDVWTLCNNGNGTSTVNIT